MHIVEIMREQGQKFAYYSCHPGIRTLPGESHPGLQVILSIVYQILEWKPDILRQRYQDFRTRVENDEWRYQDDHTIVMKNVVHLLRDVLLEMQSESTIFIALDRLDLCDWKL